MKAVEVERPHGFLIWRGKQTAIASDEPLPHGQAVTIVSDAEAYGTATLGKAAHMAVSEFERVEWCDRHRVRPEERRLWWPEAKALYVHDVTDWQPYEEPLPCDLDGDQVIIKEASPVSAGEKRLLRTSEKLPKMVFLVPGLVSLAQDGDGDALMVGAEFKNGQLIINLPAFREQLSCIARATYQRENQVHCIGGSDKDCEHLPLYSLALVRMPTLRLQRGQKTLPDFEEATKMPYTMEDYPDQIEGLPAEARRVWVETFNLVHEETDDEDVARIAAWAVVKRDYEQAEDGDWLAKGTGDEPATGERQAVIKTEDGVEFTADAYLYVPDPEKSSTWKLRIQATPGQVTMAQLGAAAAALGPGFRGQRAELPADDRRKAARQLVAEYRALDVDDEDVPDYLWALADMEAPKSVDVADAKEALTAAWVKGKKNESADEKAGRRLRGDKVELLRGIRDSFNDLRDKLGELIGWADYDDQAPPDLMAFFKDAPIGAGIREVQGEPWFFTWSTNAFEDREGEIFSTKALEDYVDEADKKDRRGHHNFWHIPGTDFTDIQWHAVVGRFLVQAGPFREDEAGQAAKAFFLQYPDGHPDYAPEGWGCSPEFRYLPEERKAGVYKWLWITRTSTLPRAAAANIWTDAGRSVEVMALEGQRKEAAEALFGAEFVSRLVDEADKRTETLEEQGVASKEAEAEATEAGNKGIAEIKDALKQLVGQIEDERTAKAIESVADKLTEGNAEDSADTLNMLAGQLKGDAKDRLSEIVKALREDGDVEAEAEEEDKDVSTEAEPEKPTPEEAPIPVEVDIEALAAELSKNFNADLTPLAEGVTTLAGKVDEALTRIEALEKTEARKEQSELPRYQLYLKRASEAEETAVKEDDPLKEQKPEETPVAQKDGSMASAFFPTK